jgi:hypothetical protein
MLLSSAGKDFASKYSEAMFLPGLEPQKARKELDDIRYVGFTFRK